MSIENKMLKRITLVIKFVIICVGIQIIAQTNLQTNLQTDKIDPERPNKFVISQICLTRSREISFSK